MSATFRDESAIDSAAMEAAATSIASMVAEWYGSTALPKAHIPAAVIERRLSRFLSTRPVSARAETLEEAAFQTRVHPWMMACFGEEISRDRIERNHRFLEEALELVQSTGCTASEAHQLVDYVYGRDVGETHQEIGGVMVTLAALCLAIGEDMYAAGETELARIWTKVEKIRAKQAAKPKHSPLPVALSTAPAPTASPVNGDVVATLANWSGWRSIDTAPEDQHVILATSGEIIGEAIMLIDEDTGRQRWALECHV